jgi:nucleotide-binding universal stress UspA family protein
MKTITLVNGSLTSHTTAIYALEYAKQLNLSFTLAYVIDQEDPYDVENSLKDIQDLSNSYEIENNFLIFENLLQLKQYIEAKDIDMLFCSTMQNKSIYDKSFLTEILKKKIKVDIAVVKVVKIERAYSVDKIVMPIRASKLSVKKFTLFSTFSLAYSAKAEIYSVDKISKMNMASVTIENIKTKLQSVIFNLRHYLRVAKMMNFKFAIKHDYAFTEDETVQAHIAKHGYDLIIMGGHHEKEFFWKHPIDILFDKPMINTIYFIPFKDEL